jgi:hypothetical protein
MSARGTALAAPPAAALPADARVIAARLAGLFEADQKIVVALNDAHRWLAAANDQLWSDPVVDRLSVHGQIDRAFCAYQHASERRRQLAVDVGELSQQLTETLTAVGHTREQARSANVHQLAAGTWRPAGNEQETQR